MSCQIFIIRFHLLVLFWHPEMDLFCFYICLVFVVWSSYGTSTSKSHCIWEHCVLFQKLATIKKKSIRHPFSSQTIKLGWFAHQFIRVSCAWPQNYFKSLPYSTTNNHQEVYFSSVCYIHNSDSFHLLNWVSVNLKIPIITPKLV